MTAMKRPTDYFPQIFYNQPSLAGTSNGITPSIEKNEQEKKKVPQPKYVPEQKTADQLFDERRQIPKGPLFEESTGLLHRSDIRIYGGNGEHSSTPLIDSFASCGFDPAILRNLQRLGYTQPTLVQQAVIPFIQGTQPDIMAHAHTGTGKSAAFLLPLINDIIRGGNGQFTTDSPHSIVVAPTRELVQQLYDFASALAIGTSVGIACAYGTIPMGVSLRNLRSGCDLLVTTIGRLRHYIEQSIIKLDMLRFLVLDEGDKFLNMEDVLKDLRYIVPIIKQSNMRYRILMFSATFERGVQELANEFIRPKYYFISIGELNQAVNTVRQTVMKIKKYEKMSKLLELLQHKSMSKPNADLETGPLYETEKTIVFINGHRECDRLGIVLAYKGYSVITLNGSRTQEQRSRAHDQFINGQYDLLVSTDVSSRGINFPNVLHVVNYDMPREGEWENYVHRIGRTGRAGNLGRSTSFFDPHSDVMHVEFLYQTLKKSNQIIPDWLEEIVKINRTIRTDAAQLEQVGREEQQGPGGVQQQQGWDEGIDYF